MGRWTVSRIGLTGYTVGGCGMTQARNLYYYQDGGDFYLFNNLDASDHYMTVNYNKVISDWDTSGAIEAKKWFMEVWCKENNIYIRDVEE